MYLLGKIELIIFPFFLFFFKVENLFICQGITIRYVCPWFDGSPSEDCAFCTKQSEKGQVNYK